MKVGKLFESCRKVVNGLCTKVHSYIHSWVITLTFLQPTIFEIYIFILPKLLYVHQYILVCPKKLRQQLILKTQNFDNNTVIFSNTYHKGIFKYISNPKECIIFILSFETGLSSQVTTLNTTLLKKLNENIWFINYVHCSIAKKKLGLILIFGSHAQTRKLGK